MFTLVRYTYLSKSIVKVGGERRIGRGVIYFLATLLPSPPIKVWPTTHFTGSSKYTHIS